MNIIKFTLELAARKTFLLEIFLFNLKLEFME